MASQVYRDVDEDRELLQGLSGRIWETPEIGLREEESAGLIMDTLAEHGFDLETGIGGMPTAFVASYGEGSPRIGVLGEYDALPGLSQKPIAEQEPVEAGAPGHGCGHNLFGVGSLGGALATKAAIERGDVDGTIVYYGCPAEETLVGKVYMARDGAFDDLDAAVAWHPGYLNTPRLDSSLAMDSMQYTFTGRSAHAAGAPDSGRSALDGVQLMNTGLEFLREHVVDEARIHYVITDGGGAPNVVPPTATVWYYVRAPTRAQVESISSWLDDIAEGAATMSQTEVSKRLVTGCYNYLPNETISDVIWDTMREVGPLEYDEADHALAADLKATLDDATVESELADLPEDVHDAVADEALSVEPIPAFDDGRVGSYSTDAGDVSWITPTAKFYAATWPVGTPSHTWQSTAASGSFGVKSTVYVAKVIAGTARALMAEPSIVAAANREHAERTGDRSYENALPPDATPPFDMMDELLAG